MPDAARAKLKMAARLVAQSRRFGGFWGADRAVFFL
ncbi:hypothetical protein IL54_2778 [Sphingobium sp. ba1]|nr:hypothetical protein IL54_2778 [Sphingobium sp. ba1]